MLKFKKIIPTPKGYEWCVPWRSTQTSSRRYLLSKYRPFRGRRLNVITFTVVRKGRPSLCRFATDSQMLCGAVCRSCIELRPNMPGQTQILLNHPPPQCKLAFTVAGFTTLTKTQQIFVNITYTELYLNYTNSTQKLTTVHVDNSAQCGCRCTGCYAAHSSSMPSCIHTNL